MQLIAYLEDEFDVAFDDDELSPEHFQTVAAMERLVTSKLQAEPA